MTLIEFTVENYRSIKDAVTLSMVATADRSLENNLIELDAMKKDRLLRSAVIYGANASGKSNVLRALFDFRLLVLNSHKSQKGSRIRFTPFKLDKECLTRPTTFSVSFIREGIKYVYSVSFTAEKVVSEELYYYPRGRIALIFERKNTSDYRFSTDKKAQKFYAEQTPENVLYLSRSTQLNYEKTAKAFEWFKDDLMIFGPGSLGTYGPEMDISIKMLENEKTKELILRALSEADLGIDDIRGKIEELSVEKLPDSFPAELKAILDNSEKSTLKRIEVKTLHGDVQFSFHEESEGTKRLFSLIGPWIDALQNGRVLVVDELDTKLHHLLNVFLIKLFHDPTQNQKNAQLIFNTHNTNLLDLKLFRRDQIWFTEKDPETGKTDLYSLVEFKKEKKPRKDTDIKKGYIIGRYGAIPFIKEERIF